MKKYIEFITPEQKDIMELYVSKNNIPSPKRSIGEYEAAIIDDDGMQFLMSKSLIDVDLYSKMDISELGIPSVTVGYLLTEFNVDKVKEIVWILMKKDWINPAKLDFTSKGANYVFIPDLKLITTQIRAKNIPNLLLKTTHISLLESLLETKIIAVFPKSKFKVVEDGDNLLVIKC